MKITGTDLPSRPNHDPQSKGSSRDDVNHSQVQPRKSNHPPQSLVDWLVRINQRLMALEQPDHQDSG